MKLLSMSVAIVLVGAAFAAEPPSPLALWPGGAPDARGNRPEDTPTITPYLPDPKLATGTGILICPGGGYGHLAPHEGEGYARWLNDHGIAAFVLKYRLGSNGYRHPAMLEDVTRAMRLVRAKAAEWQVAPDHLGVMGSSAGGHLASTLLTHFDAGNSAAADPIERASSRPDFGVLCYAVITMAPPFAHLGSRENLLGKNPPPNPVDFLSSERHVTADTPPCFIWTTSGDATVPVQNSLLFAAALDAHHVPFDLHIYQGGRHGMGLGLDRNPTHPGELLPWTGDFLVWLGEHGLLKR